MTVLLVALLVLIYSFQSLFCKLFSEHYDLGDAAQTSTVFSISYGAFAGIVTLVAMRFRFSASPATLLCGLLNAVILLLYNTAMIQASRTGSYSFQMISCLFGGIVVPMATGALFLGERLSAFQLFAIALMLISFVLINLKGLSLKGSSGRFLIWCATLFLTNGLYGVLMNWQQLAMSGKERSEMIVLTYLGMAALYALFQLIRDRHALKTGFLMPKKTLLFLLLCCLCATLASHLVLYVLTLVDATILYTIDNGGVLLLSVVYSAVLFHERLSKSQLAGIALSAVSIVMLSL